MAGLNSIFKTDKTKTVSYRIDKFRDFGYNMDGLNIKYTGVYYMLGHIKFVEEGYDIFQG